MLHYPLNGIMGWFRGFLNLQIILWRPASFPCHFYSSFLSLVRHYNHIHIWCRCIYFLWLMWWWSIRIDLIKISLLNCTRVHGCTKHNIFFILSYRSLYVCLSLVYCSFCLLVCRCPIVMLLDFFKILIDDLFCEACISLQETLLGWLEEAWCHCSLNCFMKVLC